MAKTTVKPGNPYSGERWQNGIRLTILIVFRKENKIIDYI